MKFLCDRCKTRYSIGDERVRGKILKIRCKNCANVITVREGMTPDLDAGEPGRAKQPTTSPIDVMTERADTGKAASDARIGARSDPARAPASQPASDPGRSPRAAAPAVEPSRGERRPGAQPAEPARNERARPGQAADPGRNDRQKPAGQAHRAGLSDDAARRQAATSRSTAQAARNEGSSALGAAFASAMAKPPPALEEEWYVSIDGDQEGPFSLAEAQRWVMHKPFEAELHCWSEGFDDWLPVDKVSHFRGLRKRPPSPAAPPPLPRVGGVAPRAGLIAPVEDDPKPLFAATMASLERGAPAASSQGLSLPSLGTVSPRSNGAVPLHARNEPRPVARPAATGPTTGRAVGTPFDPGDLADLPTQLEAPPFAEPIKPERSRAGRPSIATPASEPAPEPAPRSSDAALTSPHLPAASTLQGTGANASVTTDAVTAAASDFGDDDDGELAIGEVSRVVKLGDITNKRSERSGTARRAASLPGTVGRSTALGSSLRSTGVLAAMGPDGALPAPGDGDPALTMAPVATSHRRGLIMLLTFAVVLVLGVIGAVVLLVTTNDDPVGGHLGPVRDIDTSRPDDPVTHRPGTANPANPLPNPFVPRPRPRINPTPTDTSREPETPGIPALSAAEVESVARKYQETTQRCYLRSQRGIDAILVGDVKKISVLLTVDLDGNVTDVKLSEHGADSLGKCLTVMLRGWKFRQSPGGTFQFSLNFLGS